MITPQIDLDVPESGPAPEPSETFARLRIAAASRASLLRAAQLRLEDDLRALRIKATHAS